MLDWQSGLRVYRLGQGTYVEVDRSAYFPHLLLPELVRFLRRRGEMDETTLVRLFRQWAREQIGRGWQTS